MERRWSSEILMPICQAVGSHLIFEIYYSVFYIYIIDFNVGLFKFTVAQPIRMQATLAFQINIW
jgi:hypothetical protein